MSIKNLFKKAEAYMRKLCLDIPCRYVGSDGNRKATEFFSDLVKSFGFEVDTTEFGCIDWSQGGVDLVIDDLSFEAFPSPYSLGCRVHAPLEVVSTDTELDEADITGKIILLRGETAREQIMPKNFPFYNPERHQQIVHGLESRKPLAIIAATSRDVEMVGSQYPFPLFEDGDFEIPSIYMTEEEGNRLAEHAGKPVFLDSRAHRIPSSGYNVVARKCANPDRRVVLFAHIDARIGSPGAGDNASGVVTLLLLSELLADYTGDLSVEIVAMNGEDYYSNPGEQLYLSTNSGKFDTIVLGINLDDVGYHKGKIAYSIYDCPPNLAGLIKKSITAYPGVIEGEPWYQGDHGLFLMNQAPALAFTSELLGELMAEITHTPRDKPEFVDPMKLVTLAFLLRDLISQIDCQLA